VTDTEFQRRTLDLIDFVLDALKKFEVRIHALEQKVGVVQLPAGSVDGDNKSDPQYCP